LDPYRERIAYLPVLAALPALHHLGLNLVWRGRVATTPDDVAALAASPPSAPSPSPCKTLTTCGRCSLPPPFCPGRSRRCRVWSIRGSRWGGRAATGGPTAPATTGRGRGARARRPASRACGLGCEMSPRARPTARSSPSRRFLDGFPRRSWRWGRARRRRPPGRPRRGGLRSCRRRGLFWGGSWDKGRGVRPLRLFKWRTAQRAATVRVTPPKRAGRRAPRRRKKPVEAQSLRDRHRRAGGSPSHAERPPSRHCLCGRASRGERRQRRL